MEIKFLAIGNAMQSASGKPFTLNSTMLGQLQLWLSNRKKWEQPFVGITLTPEVLFACGFRSPNIRPWDEDDYSLDFDLDTIDPNGFSDVYIFDRIENVEIYVGMQDGVWHTLRDRVGNDGNVYLFQDSQSIKFLHELQNTCFWSYGQDIVYPAALDGQHIELKPNENQ